jgi:NADPH2:quinone reductase
MIPRPPFGGMAERTLVRRGAWLPVPDPVDDVTAAAFANPGMAAWKTIVWEGQVTPGQSVLVLGATGTSGGIAAQLAISNDAQVVVAGRNRRVLDQLVERGATASFSLEGSVEEVADQVSEHGPFDLIADYVWGHAAEGVFAALAAGSGRRTDEGPARTRYLLVGMTAGETASLPAMALRRAPLELVGSGTLPAPTLAESAAAFVDLVHRVAAGELSLAVETRPLAEVEGIWKGPDGGPRIVFVP